MVTNRPDLLLGILTADCSPVLFADPEAGIVAARMRAGKARSAASCDAPSTPWWRSGPSPRASAPPSARRFRGANYEVGPEFAAQIVGERAGSRGARGHSRGQDPRTFRHTGASSGAACSKPGSGTCRILASAPTPTRSDISRTATRRTTASAPAGRSPSSACAESFILPSFGALRRARRPDKQPPSQGYGGAP